MAGELRCTYATGATVYARLSNGNGLWWNGAAFEAYSAANWATYVVAMTEQGASGVYAGTMPAAATGLYSVECRQAIVPLTPAVTDPVIAVGSIDWSGTVEIRPCDVRQVGGSETPIDGKSLEAALKIMASSVAGKSSGAGTGTEVMLGLDGLTTRITGTVDGSGNRTNVVYS